MILIVLASIILFISYLNFLLKPTVANLKEINPKLQKLAQDIEKVELWSKKQAEMERQLSELRSKMSHYEVMLLAAEEIPSLLEELSEVAHRSNVKIIGIKPKKMTLSESKPKMPYQEVPISIKAKCGYHQLGRFISRLESADRLFAISDIEIKSVLQRPKSHDVTLIVSTFLPSEE